MAVYKTVPRMLLRPTSPSNCQAWGWLTQGQLQGGYLEVPMRKGWGHGSQLADLNSWPALSIDQGQCMASRESVAPTLCAKAPQLFPNTLSCFTAAHRTSVCFFQEWLSPFPATKGNGFCSSRGSNCHRTFGVSSRYLELLERSPGSLGSSMAGDGCCSPFRNRKVWALSLQTAEGTHPLRTVPSTEFYS